MCHFEISSLNLIDGRCWKSADLEQEDGFHRFGQGVYDSTHFSTDFICYVVTDNKCSNVNETTRNLADHVKHYGIAP